MSNTWYHTFVAQPNPFKPTQFNTLYGGPKNQLTIKNAGSSTVYLDGVQSSNTQTTIDPNIAFPLRPGDSVTIEGDAGNGQRVGYVVADGTPSSPLAIVAF